MRAGIVDDQKVIDVDAGSARSTANLSLFSHKLPVMS